MKKTTRIKILFPRNNFFILTTWLFEQFHALELSTSLCNCFVVTRPIFELSTHCGEIIHNGLLLHEGRPVDLSCRSFNRMFCYWFGFLDSTEQPFSDHGRKRPFVIDKAETQILWCPSSTESWGTCSSLSICGIGRRRVAEYTCFRAFKFLGSRRIEAFDEILTREGEVRAFAFLGLYTTDQSLGPPSREIF